MVDCKFFGYLSLFVILIGSCSERQSNNGTLEYDASVKQHSNYFNLHKDIFSFSEKLPQGDTLELIADLSTGSSWHTEHNIFYNHNGKIFLTSMNEGEFVNDSTSQLDPVRYSRTTESLSFENLFADLNGRKLLKGRTRFTAIYKEDTIRYGSESLNEAMEMIASYSQIKANLYPEVYLYEYPRVIQE